jgi:hypothetical protein
MINTARVLGGSTKVSQHNAVRQLARGIVGSAGLTGFGATLVWNGIITGPASRDKDERSMQEQAGVMPNSINLSALKRYVFSGLDGSQATPQKGDTYADYGWAQPMAFTMDFGVQVAKTWKEKPDMSEWSLEDLGNVALAPLTTMLEQPMIHGPKRLVDAVETYQRTGDVFKGIRSLGLDAIMSFFPSVVRQTRTATDNQQRDYKAEEFFDELGNRLMERLPGASTKLTRGYDTLGSGREKLQGGESGSLGQWLKSMLAPGRITSYDPSPEAQTVLDLLQDSGDNKLLPRQVPLSLTFRDANGNKQTVKLYGSDYADLQRETGAEVKRLVAKYKDHLTDDSRNIEYRAKVMHNILTAAGKKANASAKQKQRTKLLPDVSKK